MHELRPDTQAMRAWAPGGSSQMPIIPYLLFTVEIKSKLPSERSRLNIHFSLSLVFFDVRH
jgi:hypothetical protein